MGIGSAISSSIARAIGRVKVPKFSMPKAKVPTQALAKYDPNFAKMQTIKAENAATAKLAKSEKLKSFGTAAASGVAGIGGMGLMMGIPSTVSAVTAAKQPTDVVDEKSPAYPEEDMETQNYARGGRVDGCAVRGHTKGRII